MSRATDLQLFRMLTSKIQRKTREGVRLPKLRVSIIQLLAHTMKPWRFAVRVFAYRWLARGFNGFNIFTAEDGWVGVISISRR